MIIKNKRINCVAIIVWFAITIILLTGCRKPNVSSDSREVNYSTDTRSTSFDNKDEKMAFLNKYLIMPSEVLDAEYYIFYQDNSTGMVPGPSDWDIRVALKVKEADIPLWIEGMEEILPEQISENMWEDLKTESFTWERHETVKYYKRPESRSYLIVYPDQGIILKMMSTICTVKSVADSDEW